ncbi:MAG TPA: hypothetical protein VLH10_04615 [Yinghuangia sp.]|uniref:hypothetical protein n=1 Tax=Yinghuangia sp. YIM S10712 TaxID=3436930 RepID=UPI002BCDB82D|nr:hypothetical protein [Yinghuangia sp.]
MPDEVQDLARAAAANVVTAMGTERWSQVRATVLDVLARHTSDPAASAWVDSFGTMIATADGREQNSLRDAAYARSESVFASLLAARPEAAADIAVLTQQAPPALDFSKESAPQQPAAPHQSPGAQYAPPPPSAAPPMPGQPVPGQPIPGQFTSGPQMSPGQPAPGPYGTQSFGGPYSGAPGGMPGPAHAGGPRGQSSNRMLIGGLVAVVVAAGAIFGGVALFSGGDDDDKCASAAGRPALAQPAALTPDDCGDPVGALPGANGGKSDTKGSTAEDGPTGAGSGDVNGAWSGTYEVTQLGMDGPFTIQFTQHQDRLTGRLELDATGCDLSGPVVGKIDGNKITLDSGVGATDEISMKGTLSSGRMSGTFTTTCDGASGTWSAEKD